ncbi:hypothetical protein TI05_10590 [Achromatium sp. WMS3]|nr:hypothetical protein TI05_10590 [Achromatium sp. WMS3]
MPQLDWPNVFGRYKLNFASKTRSVFKQTSDYIKDLIQGEPGKRNMERIAEIVPDTNDQALNHMLTNPNWSANQVCDQVAKDADKLLGGEKKGILHFPVYNLMKKSQYYDIKNTTKMSTKDYNKNKL